MILILLLALPLAVIAFVIVRWKRNHHQEESPFGDASGDSFSTPSRAEAPEDQARFDALLNRFAAAGLPLAPGRSKTELLASFDVQSYVDAPDLLFLMLAGEVEEAPFGRWFCDRACTVDMECVDDENAYGTLFRTLARIAGLSDQIESLDSHVDFEAETITLSYRIGGVERSIRSDEWQNDWIHIDIYAQMLADLTQALPDGQQFWSMHEGQGEVLAVLTPAEADAVRAIIGPDLLAPAT